MATLVERVLQLITTAPGLTDREITDKLNGRASPQQPINVAARSLAKKGQLLRRLRADGLIGNYEADGAAQLMKQPIPNIPPPDPAALSEDALKKVLEGWLHASGWTTEIAWARKHGVDIRATRGDDIWVIEVKGLGTLDAMRVNYFLGILGETLQRMDDPKAKHSISLPDIPQFRGLWKRLPALAKARTGITILFVSQEGEVTEVTS